MRRFSFSSPTVAGLAISPENIHLVQLRRAKQAYILERLERFSLPAEVFAGGSITDFDLLGSTLKGLCFAEWSVQQWMVCVTASQVKMARITMPASFSDQEVESDITTQIQRTLPDKRENYRLDFQRKSVVNSLDDAVFYAAARNDYVARYERCLRSAGLSLAVMEIDIFALLRAVRYALGFTLAVDEKTAVLYLNGEYAVMVAMQGDEIIFYQQWDGASAAQQPMSIMQWVEWCATAYRQAGIGSLVISGNTDEVYLASNIMSAHWSCKIYDIDPFARMAGANHFSALFSPSARSTFLLAMGLAMREPLPWLN